MEIRLANTRGFCAGVDRAIEIVKKVIEMHGAPVYVKHEVVHNKTVVEELKRLGAIFVEDIKDILLSDYPLSLREQLLDDILEDYIPLLSNENSRIKDHIKLQEIESTVLKISNRGI